MQQALYRRLAVGVMGIAFLLKDYQIVTMRGIAAAVYSFSFLTGNSLQARIAADYVLYSIMNAYSVYAVYNALMVFVLGLMYRRRGVIYRAWKE